jgi:two-component system CheB/CheR fusion protein
MEDRSPQSGSAEVLARELAATHRALQSVREEHETAVEALHTVNARLREKVDELDRVNSDLKNLFDSTQIATVFLDRTLIVRGFTPAIRGVYNLTPSDVGRPLTDIVTKLRYDTLRADVGQVLDTLNPLERQVPSRDGHSHYILRILPYRGSDSAVSGTLVTFLDVSSVVRAEKQQRLLVDELNHRVKNMLTVVISLASQTLRRSESLESFSEAFLGRVHALSASYTLLSRENWVSISLRDVIEEEIRPFALHGSRNVALQGNEVQLLPSAALALGMAVHELATNAVKYGALSDPAGTVGISWKVRDPGTASGFLEVEWVERGGPVVSPPESTGFGMLLIQRGLAHELGGGAQIEFLPGGVRARLRALADRALYRGTEGSAHG